MASKRRRYTDEFRANACLMLEAAGYPDVHGVLVPVAQRVGVPHSTLSRWYRQKQNPPPRELVQIKREDLIAAIRAEAMAAIRAMPDARPDASYRDLGVVLGILTDKDQLLSGGATSRNENITFEAPIIEWVRQNGPAAYPVMAHELGTNLADRLFAAAGVPVAHASEVGAGEGDI